MNGNIETLLRRLRDLNKAHDKLQRAIPSPSVSKRQADSVLEDVLAALKDPNVQSLLEKFIDQARLRILDDVEAFDREMRNRRQELIALEAKMAQPGGLRRKDLELVFAQYSKTKGDMERFVTDVCGLCDRLEAAHRAAKDELAKSRELPRKKKKKRKRHLGQGIASAVFGAMAMVANTQLPIVFAFSYGLGGGALHQALRDIIGSAG
ncbi:MAG: F0F1 ATP synthase subunit delta [Deltaproteobacteria bacterium]|nr:F0F1 ATP synthase subunit delta [Deltaproteobacteria bacterium]